MDAWMAFKLEQTPKSEASDSDNLGKSSLLEGAQSAFAGTSSSAQPEQSGLRLGHLYGFSLRARPSHALAATAAALAVTQAELAAQKDKCDALVIFKLSHAFFVSFPEFQLFIPIWVFVNSIPAGGYG